MCLVLIENDALIEGEPEIVALWAAPLVVQAAPSRKPSGRPRIDDASAVYEALALIDAGKAKSPNGAFRRYARGLHQYDLRAQRSLAERLRRKHKAMQN